MMLLRASNKINFSLLLAFIFITSVNAYAWDYTRTLIVNKSNGTWTVNFKLFNGYGKLESHSECIENQECIIEPGSSKIIIYQTDSAYRGLQGMVTVTDSLGQRTIFNIDKDHWAYPNLPWLSPMDNNCTDAVKVNVTYGNDGNTSAGYSKAGGGINILKSSCKG